MYHRDGNEIRNERGTLIATIAGGGGLLMAPGKRSQEEKVRAFLQDDGNQDIQTQSAPSHADDAPDRAPEPELRVEDFIGRSRTYEGEVTLEHVEPLPEAEQPQTDAEWQVGTIPDAALPPFDPIFGTATPGFMEFVTQHNLNQEQKAALIRRICAKKGW